MGCASSSSMRCASRETPAFAEIYADPSSGRQSEFKTLGASQATTLLESPKRKPTDSGQESWGPAMTLLESPKRKPKDFGQEKWGKPPLHALKGQVAFSTQDGGDLIGTSKDETTARSFSEHAGDIGAVPAPQVHRRDLRIKGVLGYGGFGKVELVEHNESKETFALKTMSKAYLQIKGWQQHALTEKTIQMMCNSPFITRLYETYCDYDNLYLLLELALGGDVKQSYATRKLHGSKHHTQFYVAGCVCALQYLHARDVIFRDLKQENMLITAAGHIKLSDFGMSKVTTGKTFTICGTLEHLAPEMYAKVGYTSAADWWALGVATYWMMSQSGQYPFSQKFETLRGFGKVEFPGCLQGDCEAFLKELCTDDPAARLPVRQGGVKNVRSHPWFRDFDWEGMLNMTSEPPFKPNVESNAKFEVDPSLLPPEVPFRDYDDGSDWSAGFATSD